MQYQIAMDNPWITESIIIWSLGRYVFASTLQMSAGNGGGRHRTHPTTKRFEGMTEDIKDLIHDASEGRQSDQFIRMTKAIAAYMQRTFKQNACLLARAVQT